MPPDAAVPAVLARLESDGLIRCEHDGYRTTRRFQAAMARAALELLGTSDGAGDDLRLPLVHALLELYGGDLPEADVVRYVEALLPIEMQELDPRAGATRP
jgi:hypothetical protein